VAAISLAIMVVTEPRLVIVWDEGYSLGREARLRTWFRALGDPAAFARRWQSPIEDLVQPSRFLPPRADQLDTRAELFSPAVLDWFWPFAREEPDGHPPVYALVGLVGDVLVPSWEPLPRARLGPMLVFSLTCGAVFGFFQRRWGLWSALAAAGAWMFQPHLFALAHYATYDGLLTSLWTGSVLAFAKAVERGGDDRETFGPPPGGVRRPAPNCHSEPPRAGPRWRWAALFGVLLAGAMGCKLTGWFLPVPFLAWVILYRHGRGLATLVTGVVLALAVLIALMPPWWHDPMLSLGRFLQSNLSRAGTAPMTTLFLGTIYETPKGSLPWYNTAVWTAIVTPVGFLGLALVGVVRSVRRARGDPLGVLFLVNWAFLMTLRALPHTPGHDGVRQFLPAFGILALLAGLGADSLRLRLGKWGRSLILLAIVEGALSIAMMMPVPLSYYSPIVGGLRGAARIGMEPTYYWDALQPEILAWLNSHTAAGQKVMFAKYPTSWLYLRQTGNLRVKFLITEPGEWAWYVVQNRPGILQEMERDLITQGHPARVWSKWGVPLLWVFPYHDVEAWYRGEMPRAGRRTGSAAGQRSFRPSATPGESRA
jgi:4-amino-4-deoxy-L-arabinose transferase-like glycosyltransferase